MDGWTDTMIGLEVNAFCAVGRKSTINNTPIDNVEDFVYLGALIRYDSPGTSDKELSRRIGMAFSKFSSMKKILCNYKLSQVSRTLLRSICEDSLTVAKHGLLRRNN